MRAIYRKKTESGFSFIEALFAMLILSFGFVGILSLTAFMNRNTENDETKLVASKLASEKIEQILANKAAVGYSNITNGTTNETISYDNLSYQRQTVINFVNSSDLKTVSGSDTGFKRVDIIVSWNNVTTQNVAVMSLISNH